MRKVVFLLCLVLVAGALLVSCGGGSSSILEIDASNLSSDSVSVSRRTHISFQNMDPTKMYSVRTTGGSRDVSRGAISTSGVFKTNESTFVPIPDKENKAEFSGNDIEIQGSGSIQIVELHSGTGPMILSEAEDPVSYYDDRGERVYEKFFHVDFTQPPYDTIDKSRVALLMYNLGSGGGSGLNWGYVTMGAGGLGPEGYTPGLYDFSNYDYVNLYINNSIAFSNGRMSNEMILMNPVVCRENVPQDIVGKLGVYSFTPANDTTPYVMITHKTDSAYQYSDPSNLRTIDGDFIDFTLRLSSDIVATDIYYIGCLSSELLVDLSVHTLYYSGYFPSELGSVEFRPATASEIAEFESHVVSVNYDKTVFSRRFEVGDNAEFVFYLEPNGDFVPNNSVMKVEYKYDDGTYATNPVETYVSSGHTYGVGTSGNGLNGAYIEFICSMDNYPVKVSVFSNSESQPVTVTITLERSDSELREDGSMDSAKLFVIPNNGSNARLERIPLNGEYTVPTLSWKGHTFRGLYYAGSLYAPGSKIEIRQIYSAAVGVWD